MRNRAAQALMSLKTSKHKDGLDLGSECRAIAKGYKTSAKPDESMQNSAKPLEHPTKPLKHGVKPL